MENITIWMPTTAYFNSRSDHGDFFYIKNSLYILYTYKLQRLWKGKGGITVTEQTRTVDDAGSIPAL